MACDALRVDNDAEAEAFFLSSRARVLPRETGSRGGPMFSLGAASEWVEAVSRKCQFLTRTVGANHTRCLLPRRIRRLTRRQRSLCTWVRKHGAESTRQTYSQKASESHSNQNVADPLALVNSCSALQNAQASYLAARFASTSELKATLAASAQARPPSNARRGPWPARLLLPSRDSEACRLSIRGDWAEVNCKGVIQPCGDGTRQEGRTPSASGGFEYTSSL